MTIPLPSLTEYRRVSLAAMFIALLITVGITLAFIPNLELVTATAFLTGYALGPRWGWWVAGLAEAIFSAVNPLGSGLAFPLMYMLQITAIAITGLTGGLFTMLRNQTPAGLPVRILMSFVGVSLALMYDFFTAISFPLTAGLGGWSLITTVGLGMGFFLVHIVVNGILFFSIVPGVMCLISRQLEYHGIVHRASV